MKTLADFMREKGPLIDRLAPQFTLEREALYALFGLCFALGENVGIERAAQVLKGFPDVQ